jgi:hypothetical protein
MFFLSIICFVATLEIAQVDHSLFALWTFGLIHITPSIGYNHSNHTQLVDGSERTQ